MKNLINKIQEKDNIFVFLIFFIISLGIALNLSLEPGDELLNFQNVYKMYNGFKIYEEINVIITPFFFWCAELIFKIFGANLTVFRISQCFCVSLLFLFTYQILKTLKISKSVSIITVLSLVIQNFFLLIRASFNYNIMALLFFLIGIYFLLNEKTRRKIYIQVIITALIILTKQNIGIYYLLGVICYLFISADWGKERIKKISQYVTAILFFIVFFIIYLILDNNLYNFVNYTFGGLLEFASENIAYDYTAIILMIGTIIINVALSIFVYKTNLFSQKQKENVKILFVFSMFLAILCYPIFNWLHIIIGVYLMIINIIYILYIIFKDFEITINKVTKWLAIIFIVITVCFSGYHIYSWGCMIKNQEYKYSWEDPFFGAYVSEEMYNKMENVTQYIEENEKNVIIVSHKAALYMIQLKRNNGDFDLIFKGNFGIKGEDGLIEKIDNMENTQFLISKENDESVYQESEKVKEYIKNTKDCIGEIEDFYIYE